MPKASTLATSSPATVTALRDVLGVQDVLGTVNIYADTTAGLAAVADGEYFSVPSADSDEYLILYRRADASTATEIKRYPSADAVGRNAQRAIREVVAVWNVFDSAAITSGKLLLAGVLSDSASYYVTGFMPVEGGGYLTCNKTATSVSSQYGVNFYDRGQNYISKSAAPFTANTPISVPANAWYARCTFHASQTPATGVVIVQGQTLPSVYLPRGVTEAMKTDLARNKTFAIALRPRTAWNLFDKDLRITTSVLRTNGVIEANASYFVTNYMPVNEGGSITVSASVSVTSPYGMCWYDEGLAYITGVSGPFTSGQVMVAPTNGRYARFTVRNELLDTFICATGSVTLRDPTAHTPASLYDVRQWAGKQFAILGDSISDNTPWMNTMATMLRASVGLDGALAGRKMVDALKTTSGVALSSSDFTSIDACLLWLGTNDFGYSTTLGSITDSTATASFYGQTKLAVETLLTWKPTMRLVLGTLLQRVGGTTPNAGGKTALDYSAAIRAVAELYALPILDFERKAGINSVTFSTLLGDNIHPNATGYSAAVIPTALGFFSSLYPAT